MFLAMPTSLSVCLLLVIFPFSENGFVPRNDLFVCKLCANKPVFLLGGLYANLEERLGAQVI